MVLNRLFYMLSQDEEVITKKSIKNVVDELPLICIKSI